MSDENYTKPQDYENILQWVIERTGVKRNNVVRPFWPGANYKEIDYTGKVVVDNPPFSVEKKIIEFYREHNIPFFLWYEGTTLFSKYAEGLCFVIMARTLKYDGEGKEVDTGFVTNLLPYDIILAGELHKRVAGFYKTRKFKYPPPEGFQSSARLEKWLPEYDIGCKLKKWDWTNDIYGGALDVTGAEWERIE